MALRGGGLVNKLNQHFRSNWREDVDGSPIFPAMAPKYIQRQRGWQHLPHSYGHVTHDQDNFHNTPYGHQLADIKETDSDKRGPTFTFALSNSHNGPGDGSLAFSPEEEPAALPSDARPNVDPCVKRKLNFEGLSPVPSPGSGSLHCLEEIMTDQSDVTILDDNSPYRDRDPIPYLNRNRKREISQELERERQKENNRAPTHILLAKLSQLNLRPWQRQTKKGGLQDVTNTYASRPETRRIESGDKEGTLSPAETQNSSIEGPKAETRRGYRKTPCKTRGKASRFYDLLRRYNQQIRDHCSNQLPHSCNTSISSIAVSGGKTKVSPVSVISLHQHLVKDSLYSHNYQKQAVSKRFGYHLPRKMCEEEELESGTTSKPL